MYKFCFVSLFFFRYANRNTSILVGILCLWKIDLEDLDFILLIYIKIQLERMVDFTKKNSIDCKEIKYNW